MSNIWFPRIPVYLNRCPQTEPVVITNAFNQLRCSQPNLPSSLAEPPYPTFLNILIPGQMTTSVPSWVPEYLVLQNPGHQHHFTSTKVSQASPQVLPTLPTELPEHLSQAPQPRLQILGTECSLNTQISVLRHNSLTHL